jgi:hypothetical protein
MLILAGPCQRRLPPDRRRAGRRLLLWAAIALWVGSSRAARADGACRLLQYDFEPDCFERAADGTCRFDVSHPDFGPQIAVWIESADGATFVDTLMATNAVALYGIGNRPGRWDLRSGPRFPYGRRPMALPVWAHRRGSLYDSVVMDDGRDDWMTFHEPVSSPESYFCRPMMLTEVVDAVTCASGNFRGAKGIFDRTIPQSYYPPRGDLIDWGSLCIPPVSISGSNCDFGDARQFGLLNDLDVVATATPAYDRPFTGSWIVPAALPAGDYALMIEVSKEFDSDSSFAHPSFITPEEVSNFDGYGLQGNVGQPSVVYRLPFQLSAAPVPATATTDPVGYGDWTGTSGDLTPLDGQIAGDAGSGAARLRLSAGAGGPARVHLVEAPCAPLDCAVAPLPESPRVEEPTTAQPATSATFTFRQASDSGAPVIGYELRFTPVAGNAELDETSFARWAAAPAPEVAAPGTDTQVTIGGLLPQTGYAIELRARGVCGWSAPSFLRATTSRMRYLQLSGCVIATAAYGSDLDPAVALLRRQRDWAAQRSDLVRIAALLYARSAPPLAELVARSEIARAAVRSLLRPIVAADQALRTFGWTPAPTR